MKFPDPARKGRETPVLMRRAITTYDPAFVATCYGTESNCIDGQVSWATKDDFATQPAADELSPDRSLPPLTEGQRRELTRRLQAYADDPENGRAWEKFEQDLEEWCQPIVICERAENGDRRYYSNARNAEIFHVSLDVGPEIEHLRTFSDPHDNGTLKRGNLVRTAAVFDPTLIAALRAAVASKSPPARP